MPAITLQGRTLDYEPPESARYKAPLLVLPGMFQSFACWRPVTSALAHRGWEVYCLSRAAGENGSAAEQHGCGHGDDNGGGWAGSRSAISEVIAALGGRVVVLAADLGAALALSLARQDESQGERSAIMALALFAPLDPRRLGRNYAALLSPYERLALRLARERRGASDRRERALWMRLAGRLFHDRTGLREPGATVNPPRRLLRSLRGDGGEAGAAAMLAAAEPRALIDDLMAGVGVEPAAPAIPAVVMASRDDPLVAGSAAERFTDGRMAKLSGLSLDGRFWPARAGQAVVDEVHRFLVLTLGDRIVEFPDEILED